VRFGGKVMMERCAQQQGEGRSDEGEEESWTWERARERAQEGSRDMQVGSLRL
jgi:hypothetical protein